jgi:hypothetical protein
MPLLLTCPQPRTRGVVSYDENTYPKETALLFAGPSSYYLLITSYLLLSTLHRAPAVISVP